MKLLNLLKEFKNNGVTSIIISHKLNEIAYVADQITIIRDGAVIETLDMAEQAVDEARIIRGMVGRELTNRFPHRESHVQEEVVLEVQNWSVQHALYSDRTVVDDVSFKLKKGEVVGIAGLMGAGRTEFAMSIFGKSYGNSIRGTLKIHGKEVELHNERDAIKHGLAYVTEDRKGNGLILSNPIRVNTTLARLDKVSHHHVLDLDLEYKVAGSMKEKLGVKSTSVEQIVGNLSGGNQQKVLLAKWMFAEPDIMILDEPTRGIDVGAKYEIYCIINDLVAAGKSVVMISSEMPEVLGMCDRIYVMSQGKIVGEMDARSATQERIMSSILSVNKGA
jgi:putative multiple sugar transport system ATP-binding protein